MTIWAPDIDAGGPLYLAITRALERDIRTGVLQPGDRLPPQRTLADALGVNLGTVTRAYAEARRRALVRGEVGRGTYVQVPPERALDPTAHLDDESFLDLSVITPLESPGPDLAASLRRLADDPGLVARLAYQDPQGSPWARAAGVRWLARLGITTEAANVVVCAGAQHAITVSLAATAGPFEPVACEALTYPGFVGAARQLGQRVRPVEMDADGLVPEAFEAVCESDRPRVLYCMPGLQNPTCVRMPAERREAIVDVARRFDVVLVTDDIQGGVAPDPEPSLAALAPERTISIAGLSKNHAPGLRIAFIAAPADRISALTDAVWSTVWMASPVGQALLADWLLGDEVDSLLAARREEMEARHRIACDVLADPPFQTLPSAYHVWLTLPEPWEAPAFAAALRARGVAVSTAEAFRVGQAPTPAAIRIALSSPRTRDGLRRGLETIATLLAERPDTPTVRL